MVRRPVAWVVAVVLFAEAFGVAALNWFLGVVVDRQDMSLAGLDPDTMATSSKIGGVVFGLYFLLCGVVALLVAVRDRSPAGLGRVLLITAAVVHGLLGAFAWGPFGPPAFVFMIVVLALVVLLLMTYDGQDGVAGAGPGDAAGGGTPAAEDAPGAPRADARATTPAPGAEGAGSGPGEPHEGGPVRLSRPAVSTTR
ncbi:hypothetical protein AB0F77_01400 [Streptomyces sp. NPDC026672]|uniref:hypothetical protein n=1 Tax=unclassified Streptomyces TaxID=2593676 RepID=UPI0033FCFE8E